MSGGTGIFSVSLRLQRKKIEKRILTFSAKVKIFLWSTPPNWASTFKYSSSKACGEKTHEHQFLLYFFYMHLGNQKLLTSYVKGTHKAELVNKGLLSLNTRQASWQPCGCRDESNPDSAFREPITQLRRDIEQMILSC